MTGEGAAPTCLARIGRYQVVRPLAQGGMAELYLARRVDRAGGPAVALKVLGRARAADPEARAMFLDEARVAGLLAHPNIAAAVEVDELDGHCLLAMEYVDGADLRVLLAAAQRAGVAIPLETALSIVSAAALGLDHAHRRCAPDGAPLRLVHRDVSLSNIMVGRAGEVKVIDFGIATTAIASVHTSPGVVRGKASYMSPEQCLGDRVDARSDVFALGVVLYELTTGARCFHGKTDFERMLAVVRSDYLPPGDLVADYPPELEQVIRTALAPTPAERFASAAELAAALDQVAIARGWVGGAGAIRRLVAQVLGDAPATPAAVDDAPVTEPHSLVSLPTVAEPTRPARRLARGTAAEHADDDELDERTRGRAPLRRPSWLHLAA